MDRLYRILGTLLKQLPDSAQCKAVNWIVSRPQRKTPLDREFHHIATPIQYGNKNEKTAWSLGNGPLVLCIHGWGGGGSADLGKLARAIAQRGFKVVALDMTGHGATKGRSIGFRSFIDDIAHCCSSLREPVYASIGFSAGGLSMMAARAKGNLVSEKFICIASPCKPYPPLKLATKKLGLSQGVARRFRDQLAREFDMAWEQITTICFTPHAKEQLLLVYDRTDKFINSSDVHEISTVWDSAEVLTPSGIKHRLIPQDDTVIYGVIRFLTDNQQKSNQPSTNITVC